MRWLSYYDEVEPDGYSTFYCDACNDIGWMECDCKVIPCTECSAEVELEDLDQ